MNYKDALYNLVRTYPGGAEALAPRLGCTVGVLRNKVSVNTTTNVPSIEDFSRLCAFSGNYAPMHALAEEHGFVLVKIDEQPAGDLSMLEISAEIWASHGKLGKALKDALEDGKMEQHEADAIKRAAFEASQSMMQLVARAYGMAEK